MEGGIAVASLLLVLAACFAGFGSSWSGRFGAGETNPAGVDAMVNRSIVVALTQPTSPAWPAVFPIDDAAAELPTFTYADIAIVAATNESVRFGYHARYTGVAVSVVAPNPRSVPDTPRAAAAGNPTPHEAPSARGNPERSADPADPADPTPSPAPTLVEVTPSFFDATGCVAAIGRLFVASETAEARPVAVLGAAAADALFAEEDPIGRDVSDGARAYRVVGVLSDAVCGPSVDNSVIVPDRHAAATIERRPTLRGMNEAPPLERLVFVADKGIGGAVDAITTHFSARMPRFAFQVLPSQTVTAPAVAAPAVAAPAFPMVPSPTVPRQTRAPSPSLLVLLTLTCGVGVTATAGHVLKWPFRRSAAILFLLCTLASLGIPVGLAATALHKGATGLPNRSAGGDIVAIAPVDGRDARSLLPILPRELTEEGEPIVPLATVDDSIIWSGDDGYRVRRILAVGPGYLDLYALSLLAGAPFGAPLEEPSQPGGQTANGDNSAAAIVSIEVATALFGSPGAAVGQKLRTRSDSESAAVLAQRLADLGTPLREGLADRLRQAGGGELVYTIVGVYAQPDETTSVRQKPTDPPADVLLALPAIGDEPTRRADLLLARRPTPRPGGSPHSADGGEPYTTRLGGPFAEAAEQPEPTRYAEAPGLGDLPSPVAAAVLLVLLTTAVWAHRASADRALLQPARTGHLPTHPEDLAAAARFAATSTAAAAVFAALVVLLSR